MRKLSRNIITKILLLLCMLVQTAMLFPHHHHEGLAVACINPLHCLETETGHDHDSSDDHMQTGNSCGSHEASHSHDAGDSECRLSHMDIVVPARDQKAAVVPVTDFCQYGAFHVCAHDGIAEGNYKATVSITRDVWRPLPLFTAYISRAIPPRAPSIFTV